MNTIFGFFLLDGLSAMQNIFEIGIVWKNYLVHISYGTF